MNTFGDYLYIHDNPNLSNFSGLDNISSITTGIYIDNNSGLLDFSELSGLISVGYVDVRNNANLITLSALSPNLSNMTDYLSIFNNASLTNFTGLNMLTSINGYLFVEDNAILVDFAGLNNLGSVGAFFRVVNNTAILNLNGFDSLTSVGTYFHVESNAAMTTLNGVESLATIGTNIEIVGGMPNLTDISGILNIDYTTITGLFISDNTSLAICEELNICTYLDNGGASSISGNALRYSC